MKLSARNQLPGTVLEVVEGAVNGIVKIEVAPGLVISSSITNAAIEELGLKAGSKAVAVIKASNVIVGLRVKMCVWLGVSRGLDLAFLNAD